jgi:hypothetical protein
MLCDLACGRLGMRLQEIQHLRESESIGSGVKSAFQRSIPAGVSAAGLERLTCGGEKA